MGKVYAAEHVHMRKQVAIKVLHPEMSSSPDVVARFEREAVAAGNISHPNVAAATDFGRLANHSFFLVLEYVAGTDLRALLRDGPLPKERAVRIVKQIAAAVGAAHAAGVVHRDLKPENIMLVERDGDPDFVKVLDFGIAKIDAIGMSEQGTGSTASGPSGAQPLTKMGAVFGTPDYMSPEQALGQPIDGRSDLYSIGIILYELLTGERPFKGGAVTLMRKQVLEEPPALPVNVSESAGPQFDAVLRKLLQKSAQDRYANAAELVAALDDLSGTAPVVVASSPSLPYVSEQVRAPVPSRASVPRVPSGVDMARPSSQSWSEPVYPAGIAPKRRSRGLFLLTVVAAAVAGFYYLGLSPQSLLGQLFGRVPELPRDLPRNIPPQASAALSAAESALGSALANAPSVTPQSPVAPSSSSAPAPSASALGPVSGTDQAVASATSPIGSAVEPLGSASAAPADSTAAPEEPSASEEPVSSVAPPVGSTPPGLAGHHSPSHLTQTRPASKTLHKTNKPAPAPPQKHPLIPPPSQWFKN